ncbi:MAG: cyclic nucleotide-binding domain-containing protein [Microthrixaceae bacterium]|nr:cyclic nucleotide-binding domain-containing protein [Microthrixaceae bacterium]
MSDQPELRSLLEGTFGAVTTGACDRMIEFAQVVEVAPSGRVFSEGGTADALYVVLSGTIQLGVNQRERDLAVASVGPGELLGWSWLVPPHRWGLRRRGGRRRAARSHPRRGPALCDAGRPSPTPRPSPR